MRALPLLVLLATLAFVGASLFSSFDGIDGTQLPVPQGDPPIQPPGWTFSIWSVIFAGLIASAVYGLWRRAGDPGWDRTRLPLLLSLVVGVPWLWVAERSALWATVMIVVMAGLAVLALLRAPRADRLSLLLPLGLYAGWLTAATWVAVASTGAGYGLVAGPDGWAVLGVLGAIAVAVPVMLARRDAVGYALAVAWALLGITLKNLDAGNWVALTAEIGLIAVLALAARAVARPDDPDVSP